MGMPFALDHGSVLLMGAAQGADMELLAAALPAAERAIIDNLLADMDGE